MRRPDWDTWFLACALNYALRSKHPTTKVGAVIVRPDNTIVSSGYNGLPRGIQDTKQRLADMADPNPPRPSITVHAEMNALHTAKEDITGCSLYTYPLFPCYKCVPHLIQRRIGCVTAPYPPMGPIRDGADHVIDLLNEAGIYVKLRYLPRRYVQLVTEAAKHLGDPVLPDEHLYLPFPGNRGGRNGPEDLSSDPNARSYEGGEGA